MGKSKKKRYFVVYKPFGMLTQFTGQAADITLAHLAFQFPKDVYPVGRLDKDSEGLLLLTNDTAINHKLLHPAFRHSRSYWVQVEGIPTAEALQSLQEGVSISVGKATYFTLPAEVSLLPAPPMVPPRNPPIRFRKDIPTSWLSLTLAEGKNRQVRKMTASAGYPTLRLIRYKIGELQLGEMQPGQVLEISAGRIKKALFAA